MNADKRHSEKKYYFMYDTFYTNLMVTTKDKFGAEAQNIKKDKTEGKKTLKITELK